MKQNSGFTSSGSDGVSGWRRLEDSDAPQKSGPSSELAAPSRTSDRDTAAKSAAAESASAGLSAVVSSAGSAASGWRVRPVVASIRSSPASVTGPLRDRRAEVKMLWWTYAVGGALFAQPQHPPQPQPQPGLKKSQVSTVPTSGERSSSCKMR